MYIKLSTYAKNNDCTYTTAYNRYKKGVIIGKQLDSGAILILDETYNEKNNSINDVKNCAIYCRVSTNDRKHELDTQAERLLYFANKNGYSVYKVVKEVASGMNDNRPKLMKLFNDDINTIIVENKDRLTRFGFNYIKKLYNGKIIVVNSIEDDKKEIMDDLISIITSFCGRIYGNRKSKNVKKKIINEVSEFS